MLAIWVPVLVWIVLLGVWGRFWRADQRLGDAPAPPEWPSVAVAIPARNEAASIGAAVTSHLNGGYPGAITVTVADDASTDGTGDIARSAADGDPRLSVIAAPPLRDGWTGKLNALDAAVAATGETRYILLTDADIAHEPGTLARLVAEAEADGLALLSVMARLDGRGFWGRLLVPAFVFFFQKLYPFPWVNDPARSMAAAAGGCVLIRRDALGRIGGLAALKGALIDDCTLARLVKIGPPKQPIRLVLSAGEVISLRDNQRFGTIWTMVARTAYTQLRYSPMLLAGSVVGMVVVYLWGPVAALTLPVHGDLKTGLLGAVVWGLSAMAYRPTLADYGGGWGRAFTLPAAAFLYTLMTIWSGIAHGLGRGGKWKGRTYPAGRAS